MFIVGRIHVHPLSNERWVNEVKRLLSAVDNKRICLQPYVNQKLTFTGVVSSIGIHASGDNHKTTRVCVSDVICAAYSDIHLGHVNLFISPYVFARKYSKLDINQKVKFSGVVHCYGPYKDRYGIKDASFL